MVTSPSISPRTAEFVKPSKHHIRRKSTQTSHHHHHHHVSDRKASRPGLSRRATPQYISRSSSSTKVKEAAAKTHDDSDGEAFPQYCTICETLTQNNDLYCSEQCRLRDLNSASYPTTPPLTPHLAAPNICDLDRDIIPRASPTQSRPVSYYEGTEDAGPYAAGAANSKSSTALASLRELATALPPVRRPSETDLPSGAQSPREKPASSIMWGYVPFAATAKASSSSSNLYAKSYSAMPSPYVTPGTSYTGYTTSDRQSRLTSTSYGGMGFAAEGMTSGTGMDRPLPPRFGPSSHRPRSIDLVTPYPGVGHY